MDLEPTQEQIDDARLDVERRGWKRSNAKHHRYCPKETEEDGGGYRSCKHCHASTNPARWPLFFRRGPLAGRVVNTCSTCKIAQADVRSIAMLLVELPNN